MGRLEPFGTSQDFFPGHEQTFLSKMENFSSRRIAPSFSLPPVLTWELLSFGKLCLPGASHPGASRPIFSPPQMLTRPLVLGHYEGHLGHYLHFFSGTLLDILMYPCNIYPCRHK